jgi:type IV pilus assembly protein PilA
MKRLQQGFTLIELMIVVAIVGILAAIALPAYQDYVVRSKMSEAIAAIAACKTSVAEYASSHTTFPPDTTASGCSTTATKYVAALAVTANTGEIIATSQNTGAQGGECELHLTPNNAPTAITVWVGTFVTCSSKYVPSSFR